MKLLTGLFRNARKHLSLVHDNDMGAFREKLNELIEQKDSLSDEDIAAKVDELKGLIADLPESDDKSKLDRFLEDFKSVKEQDLNVAKEAGNSVADLFEKLDKAAMEDVPEAAGTEEVVAEETTTEEPAEEGKGDEVAEEVAEETVAPETKEEETEEGTSDAEADPEISFEDIYQYCKKRFEEDSKKGDETETEEVAEEESTDGAAEGESLGEYMANNAKADDDYEKKNFSKGMTGDSAPFIAVTMNNKAASNGGLAEMFATIKNGGVR